MADLVIVDDDTDTAEMLSELLRIDGHEVRLARDGAPYLVAKPCDFGVLCRLIARALTGREPPHPGPSRRRP